MSSILKTILLITTISSISALNHRSSFGEACNKTQRCNTRAWLGCSDGVCNCIKEDEMFFDSIKGKCVSKSGERCKYAIDESEENSIYEITDCVENSSCTSDGICTCGSKYYENFNGTCSTAKSHNQTCSTEEKCSIYEFLFCQENKCLCNTTISTYSQQVGHCVGLAGSQCIKEECVEGSYCSNGVCTCLPHTYRDFTGNCLPKRLRQESCSSDDQCQYIPESGLILKCVYGYCDCDPDNSIYSDERLVVPTPFPVPPRQHVSMMYSNTEEILEDNFQRLLSSPSFACVGLVDHLCILGDLCTSNAKCEAGRCHCTADYSKSANKTCGFNYGQTCQATPQCIDGLICEEMTCACKYPKHQVFDYASKMCRSIVRGPCTTSNDCVENANCVLYQNNVTGHCECRNEDYVESSTGECDLAHGTTCYSKDRCDRLIDLKCTDGVCKCSNRFSSFNKDLRKCVSLVGGKCNIGVENECVENAECLPRLFGLPSKCTCKLGYDVSKNYTCEILGSLVV